MAPTVLPLQRRDCDGAAGVQQQCTLERGMSADRAMQEVYNAAYATLHVRVSNKAACHLYKVTLGYECVLAAHCHSFRAPACTATRSPRPTRPQTSINAIPSQHELPRCPDRNKHCALCQSVTRREMIAVTRPCTSSGRTLSGNHA